MVTPLALIKVAHLSISLLTNWARYSGVAPGWRLP